MADYCTKCAKEMGFPTPDINVQEIFESLADGYNQSGFICEGCGMVSIGRIAGELKVMRISDEVETCDWEDY